MLWSTKMKSIFSPKTLRETLLKTHKYSSTKQGLKDKITVKQRQEKLQGKYHSEEGARKNHEKTPLRVCPAYPGQWAAPVFPCGVPDREKKTTDELAVAGTRWSDAVEEIGQGHGAAHGVSWAATP
jgi:hypothetical protein